MDGDQLLERMDTDNSSDEEDVEMDVQDAGDRLENMDAGGGANPPAGGLRESAFRKRKLDQQGTPPEHVKFCIKQTHLHVIWFLSFSCCICRLGCGPASPTCPSQT